MTPRTGPQDIRIFGIQDRSNRPEARKPRIVRWRIDGRDHSQALRTKAEADRLRSRLLVAQQDGERFDRQTGWPQSWTPRGGDTPLHVWARQWVAEQWTEWAPRTRNEDVYSLSRLIPHVTRQAPLLSLPGCGRTSVTASPRRVWSTPTAHASAGWCGGS